MAVLAGTYDNYASDERRMKQLLTDGLKGRELESLNLSERLDIAEGLTRGV